MELPLSNSNIGVGRLVIGRADGSRNRRERRLLADLSRHAAVALHGMLLSEDVQRSRERLVEAREEERRRLRRDLHDGLGPALAAVAPHTETGSLPMRREAIVVELERAGPA